MCGCTAALKDVFPSELNLQIVSACSGDVLIEKVVAQTKWTVQRLKLAMARMLRCEIAEIHLLSGHRLLLDAEQLRECVPDDISVVPFYTLSMVRTLLLSKDSTKSLPMTSDSRITVISQGYSTSTLRWLVDGRILRKSDKHQTTPTLELNLRDGLDAVPFKLSIFASGTTSFRKSGGRGFIQMKCMGDLRGTYQALTDISVTVNSPYGDLGVNGAFFTVCTSQPHNFSTAAAARLPRQGEIDFGAFVDRETGCFEILIDVVHPPQST